MTTSLGDTCICRFVLLLLGSDWPSAKGSLAVHQVLYFTSFRVLLFFRKLPWVHELRLGGRLSKYLRTASRREAGSRKLRSRMSKSVAHSCVHGGWPKTAFQCIQGLHSVCCVRRRAEGRLPMSSGMPSLLFCTWRAAENPISIVQVCILLPCRSQLATAAFQDVQVYFLCLLRQMAGGPRPPFSKFTFAVSFFAVYGGLSGAAVQCIHACIFFATHGGQPKVAFQHI